MNQYITNAYTTCNRPQYLVVHRTLTQQIGTHTCYHGDNPLSQAPGLGNLETVAVNPPHHVVCNGEADGGQWKMVASCKAERRSCS